MKAGDRVEIHPSFDLWMMGARFGEIVKILPSGKAKVQLDKIKKPVSFFQADLNVIG